jgi:hypothetical protein
MWNIFKSKEDKEIDQLTTKLVKTIVKSDLLRQLIIDAKKQWEYDELKSQKLSYPIIQDLINSAYTGVEIVVRTPEGASFTIRPDKDNQPDALTRAEEARRQKQRENY